MTIAEEFLKSNLFFVIVGIIAIAFIVSVAAQVFSTVVSAITHFSRGSDFQNAFIIPDKWFGLYFGCYFVTCMVFRDVDEFNVIQSIVMVLGLVSMFVTGYHRFVTEKK